MEEDILNEYVAFEDLRKHEHLYREEVKNGSVSRQTEFNYAWCLVRSRYSGDVRKGITILQNLVRTEGNAEGNAKRDYLYYLALGHARIKEYQMAMHYTNSFLQVEPANEQVITLERLCKKKLNEEGLKGMALLGGAVLAVGSIVGLTVALLKGKK